MASLSAVLITRDAKELIGRTLAALSWADEIVVVDSGSSDGTVERAREYTDKVYSEREWRGFGLQRQRAQDRASGDWILMVDADEIVTPGLRREIEAVLAADDRSAIYGIPILPWVFGRFIRHSGWHPDHKLRLYPRERARFDNALVHESLEYESGMQVIRLESPLLHFSYRDLHHYLSKSADYAKAWADARERDGRRASLVSGLSHGAWCFLRMYVLKAGFLDGRQGFLLALLSAHSTFAKYADLWTRDRGTYRPEEKGDI